MSIPASIHIKDLEIFSGKDSLVTGINLTVHSRKTTGLIGASGSGKSLTCLSVLDLIPNNLTLRGSIQFQGLVLEKGCRPAAMILQNPMTCFNPIYTIKSHFRETYRAAKRSWNALSSSASVSILSEVGFQKPEEILNSFPFQLSGGMLQRVMIAQALAQDVRFIIADEPTTDLDMVAQSRVLDLLENLQKEKDIGILLVTHDLGVIARMADEVAVMYEGRIVDQGKTADVFSAPGHWYSRELIHAHEQLYAC